MRIIRDNIYDMNDSINILYENNILNTNIKELKTNKTFNQSSFFIVEDYLINYNDYLKDVEREYKNKKNIKCIKLEIAFKFKKDKAYLKKITNRVISYFTAESYFLPYVGFVNDNQNKLILIIFDRYFYPNGKKVDIIAKSDYKNGKFKKGDVIRQEIIYITHKIRIFNFATKEQLSKYFEILRQYLVCNDKDIDKDIISDKKYVNKNGKHYKRKRKDTFYDVIAEFRMRKIRAYNTLIRKSKLKMIDLPHHTLKSFRSKINKASSVFEFEEEVQYIIQTIE